MIRETENDISTPRAITRGETLINWRELAELTAGFAGEFASAPLLEHILDFALNGLNCTTGSISTVDEAAATYTKAVDVSVACKSGRTFPLDEGVTGAVARARSTVIYEDYSEVENGHLNPVDRANIFAVIGVPIMWSGTLIGSVTVFSTDPDRRFGEHDAEFLEIIAAHAAIGMTNARLFGMATERATELAVTAERDRLFRSVSDTAGRELAALRMNLGSIYRTIGDPQAMAEAIKRAQSSADRAWRELRRTASAQVNSTFTDRSLIELLGLELVWLESRHGLRTDLKVSGEPFALSPDVNHHVFRMVQQTLTNIVQHAHGTVARIGMVYSDEKLRMILADDGVGFDPSLLEKSGSLSAPEGHGFAELFARAEQIGGSVLVNAVPGWGVRLEFTIPRSDEDADAARSRIRVLVAHPQAVMRAGIIEILALNEPSIQIVAEVSTPSEALEAYKLLSPHVTIGALDRSSSGGQLLTSVLRSHDPQAAIVLLTDSKGDDQVRLAAQMGVRGLIGRDIDPAGLTGAVLTAARGDTIVAGELLKHLDGGMVEFRKAAITTTREREVRELIAQGYSNKQIATALGISVKTVEKHVGTLLKKTGARNRTMLSSLPSHIEPA